MNKPAFWIPLCAVALISVVLVARLFAGPPQEPEQPLAYGQGEQPQQRVNKATEAPAKPAVTPSQTVANDPAMATRVAFAAAAEQYAHNARYPAYSLPVDEDTLEQFLPPGYSPVVLPLANDMSVAVSLSSYRVMPGNLLDIDVAVQGGQLDGDVRATLAGASLTLEKPSDQSAQGQMTVPDAPGEHPVEVTLTIAGEGIRHQAPVSIEAYIGEVTGLGSPDTDEEHLLLPVEVDPESAGFYRLEGTLLVNGSPVARLDREEQLSGSGTIELRVHGSLFAGRDFNGQSASLEQLQLTRQPARPGDAQWINPQELTLEFEMPDLDDIRRDAYEDATNAERLTFLESMGQEPGLGQ
ncbi:MAG: hypothetical protein EA349_08775 [Halomonadaceae bacterium]|nr:MAG: hypothetical protein EA349_08775 [Halomonadaceae bacterium]